MILFVKSHLIELTFSFYLISKGIVIVDIAINPMTYRVYVTLCKMEQYSSLCTLCAIYALILVE